MTFKDFIETYEGSYSLRDKITRETFDNEVVSYKEFVELYHKAVRLGLIPDDASVFMHTFNVEFDFNLDASVERLSLTDWVCKHDPWSFWYKDFWNDMVDKKITINEIAVKIMENIEEVTRKMTSKSYNPTAETNQFKPAFSCASPITKEDLEKYKMPYVVNESEEDIDF